MMVRTTTNSQQTLLNKTLKKQAKWHQFIPSFPRSHITNFAADRAVRKKWSNSSDGSCQNVPTSRTKFSSFYVHDTPSGRTRNCVLASGRHTWGC